MRRFKVLVGSHAQGLKLYSKGEVLETEDPLDRMYPGRFLDLGKSFKEVPTVTLTAKDPEEIEVPQDSTEDQEEELVAPEATIEGNLVDGDFDFSPEDTGLHVYFRQKRFWVYDTDNLETPLNSKGLVKAKVLPFLRAQCED